jgi:sugar lactone lactonase YvrE
VTNVTLGFDVGATLGEAALWDWRSDRLLSVDVLAGRVLISDPADGSTRELRIGQPVSAALLHGDTQLLLAVRDGFTFADVDTGELGELVPVEADVPENRMNDAACDARGRCFAGTMAYDTTPGAGALYRLDPDLSVHTVADGISVSNGIGWSPAGEVMYYVDTGTPAIDAFSYDERTGEASERRRLTDTDPAWGAPDGLTMDAEGGIWVAFWGGGAVRRFGPSGALEAVLELPAARPTKPAFGGADLARMYVTTARLDDRAAASGDLGGAILTLDPGVRGPRANPFGSR